MAAGQRPLFEQGSPVTSSLRPMQQPTGGPQQHTHFYGVPSRRTSGFTVCIPSRSQGARPVGAHYILAWCALRRHWLRLGRWVSSISFSLSLPCVHAETQRRKLFAGRIESKSPSQYNAAARICRRDYYRCGQSLAHHQPSKYTLTPSKRRH